MRKIMFVCAENAGRSQMAEAFFNMYVQEGDLVAESAGTTPADAINPVAVAAMQEKGIDISSQAPKQFDPTTADQYERLISFGCLVKSAFTPDIQQRIEDWEVDDPKGKDIPAIRQIRDHIGQRVRSLVLELRA
ncbi:MAG: hypothetical protein WEC84_04260 [Candidatus Andersenbacteria bacterium]